jgi:hypothetical protein
VLGRTSVAIPVALFPDLWIPVLGRETRIIRYKILLSTTQVAAVQLYAFMK